MARKRRRSKAKKDTTAVPESQTESVSTQEVVVQKETKPVKQPVAAVKAAPAKTTTKKGPSAGSRMKAFFKDVRAEMKKVSWPDRERTTNSTVVVIFTLVFLAILMAAFTALCTKIAEYFFSTSSAAG